MQYLGGKSRIAMHISDFLEKHRVDMEYLEPFVGGAWIPQEMTGTRTAGDGNPYLITMYKSLIGGWTPPDSISQDLYDKYKFGHKDINDPLVAFIGIGCSFSGKWFGGYARSETRNYAKNCKNSLLKQLPLIASSMFEYGDYRELTPSNKLVYCDPPYEGTTGYGVFNGFDNADFWRTMREWSKNNTVVVSEYSAPQDFVCVKEMKTRTDMYANNNLRTEKLFMHKGAKW